MTRERFVAGAVIVICVLVIVVALIIIFAGRSL